MHRKQQTLSIASALLVALSGSFVPIAIQDSSQPYRGVSGLSISTLPMAKEAPPYLRDFSTPLTLEAASALAIDITAHRRLYEKSPTEKRATASLAKLMTAIVVESIANPASVGQVLQEDLKGVPTPVMGLVVGEKISIESLMRGMLVESANDAASVLARTTAGSQERFVELMNLMAGAMGLRDTVFKNPTGLDEEGEFSTADDLSLLAEESLSYEKISKIVRLKSDTVTSSDGTIIHYLRNSNRLLEDPRVEGMKTGFTEQARGNLILLIAGPPGHLLLTVVLGSENREAESEKLMKWILDSYEFD